jgi:hypothetical protein
MNPRTIALALTCFAFLVPMQVWGAAPALAFSAGTVHGGAAFDRPLRYGRGPLFLAQSPGEGPARRGAPQPPRRGQVEPPRERAAERQLTPQERQQLRREIRNQGRDVYGQRPAPPRPPAR